MIVSHKLRKAFFKINDDDIFIFGIQPKYPSDQFGYFLTKKKSKNTNKVIRFIEKPIIKKAREVIKKKGYWNSGIIFSSKMGLWNSFYKHDSNTLRAAILASKKGESKCLTFGQKILYLNKKIFN